MKIKHALALLILGFLVNIIGAGFKILHLQFAPQLLFFGFIIIAIALLLLIIKLFTNKKFKDFLNS